jgi:hypothetical protein
MRRGRRFPLCVLRDWGTVSRWAIHQWLRGLVIPFPGTGHRAAWAHNYHDALLAKQPRQSAP